MSPETTDFLYPFIEGDERDVQSLLDDLARSAESKWAESERLRELSLERNASHIAAAATAMAERFAAGGRLFTMGNGGSATDAAAVARLFAAPPVGAPVPARSLAADTAVLTALSNDIGFDVVFARQVIAHATARDVLLGLSTSGNSENLLVAFAEATRRGMLTVGVAGYDGGAMAASPDVHHCLVVAADSTHRIQEVQVALTNALWRAVQDASPEGGQG